MKKNKFLIGILIMTFLFLGCSSEADVKLSKELIDDGFKILETDFVKDHGRYYIITNKPLQEKYVEGLVKYDYIVTVYENSSNNFFDSFMSFFGLDIKNREINKYPLSDVIPDSSQQVNDYYELYNYHYTKPSSMYVINTGVLGMTDIIDKIVISRKTKRNWN